MFGNKDPQPRPISQYTNTDPNAGANPTPRPPTNPYPSGPNKVSFVPPKNTEKNKTVVLFALAVAAIVFAGLFVWKFLDWASLNNKIEMTVSDKIAEQKLTIENEAAIKCEERESSNREGFDGPTDYGALHFTYPRNWSFYVARDTTITGNDGKNTNLYEAYLNPGGVGPITNDSAFALRVFIVNRQYTDVAAEYNDGVSKGTYTHTSVSVNENETTADIYESTFQTGLKRKDIIFKIRTQTAIIRTDSVDNFGAEFNKIIDSITFEK